MSVLWNTLLVNPLLNILVGFFQLTGNLGISIILLTVLIRTVLIPLVLPSMKNMQKQRDLQPQIEKIKKKYKYDKKKQAEMQMALLKEHGLNPAAGCLTQIPMFIVLIALFNVIGKFSNGIVLEDINALIYFDSFKFVSLDQIKTSFLWMDLGKADPYYVLAILSGVFQFFASKMTQPYVEEGGKAAKKTPDKKDDIAYNMQEQMLYMMPIMTVIIGLRLPAGTVLYILVTTVFSIFQTYFVSGWGGLSPYIKKLKGMI